VLTLVIDSNIWLSQQMLRHSLGSAVRFFLNATGAKVAVPQVVRREVELHLSKKLRDLSLGIRESHRELLTLVGSLKQLVIPPDETLDEVAQKAFDSSGIQTIDIPFSLDSARSSLDKCILGLPPSGPKDQQFKDGVVWADCLKLAIDNPVLLVTRDKGFYHERNYAGGLAYTLRVEASAAKHEIAIAHELGIVLEQVRVPIEIDYERLSGDFLLQTREELARYIGAFGFTLGGLLRGEHKLFATENPEQGHLEFSLWYHCVAPDSRSGTLIAQGEAAYSPTESKPTNLRSQGMRFSYSDIDGQEKATGVVNLTGTFSTGHVTVPHVLRVPLPD
jgi:hypothetical protein